MFLEYIKNIGRRKYQRGATSQPQGGGAGPTPWARLRTLWAPWQASGAHLWLYGIFYPGKNQEEDLGTKHLRHEAEPWRNQSRAPAELFCRGNIPPGGGNHHHRSSHQEGAISINILTSTIPSQTLVHLLYPIFVSKPRIGTCGSLVVLITPCS